MKSYNLSSETDNLLICYQVMFTDFPDIVSVIQLQQMLNISRQLAYELIGNGSIKAVKVGNSYRIPKVSVIGYMLNAA
ncbi:MAG: helix-turn-helix domain-containing protein [Ruminococcaceae bacterium]|nr:helix-turn-helix domain-containing protein [Oscillospiraceae bacterium]